MGISSGQEPEVLRAAGAAVVVKDFHQLLEIIAAQTAAKGRGEGGKQGLLSGVRIVASAATGAPTQI